jgi:hypothetical protein
MGNSCTGNGLSYQGNDTIDKEPASIEVEKKNPESTAESVPQQLDDDVSA